MDYTEFIEAMLVEVRKHIPADVTVDRHAAVKNNGTVRVGLVLMRQGINMSPTIYLEEFYEQYLEGAGLLELARTLAALYEKVKVAESYPCGDIFSYQKVRDRIVYKLIQRKMNEELLRQVPYSEYLDLAVVFYVLLEGSAFGTATLLVRNEHLCQWNTTREEISEAARKNTPRLLPGTIEQLANYMYVLSNQKRNMGAAAMLYPDIMGEAESLIGENFYILPSSIHEVILIPESHGVNREQLKSMVEEINKTEVEPEDVLSDSVYYYSGKEGRILQ
ncbi:MAG: hypothetical protein HFG41_10765 [Coprococcus sp.]|nr:hypothetical protein [Coprococcus sp.]